jgi:predicted phage baseplate assembly protein
MPIVPPRLDDRSFEDLVEELVARIPSHTPEWTNVREGDPGRTLLELFAWLGDTLLYRANLIPERQRLAFLRLLGAELRPALPATGVVSVRFDAQDRQSGVVLRPGARLPGAAPFETRAELPLFHLTAEAYVKRPLTEAERASMAELLPGLARVYGLASEATATFYATTPVFPHGAAEPEGVDLMAQAVDRCLWLALLAPKAADVVPLRNELAGLTSGAPRLLSVGVQPALEVPALAEEVGTRARIPHQWELTGPVDERGQPTFHPLTPANDSTQGLTRRGVLHLMLPGNSVGAPSVGAPSNDVRQSLQTGVGDRPPRLDDAERASRLVTWLRLRPTTRLARLALSWVDVNAVEVDQRTTWSAILMGQSDGSADQQMRLPAGAVERDTLQLEVEEPEQGYRAWAQVEDLALAGRDSAVYALDAEAGLVRFGDGVRGRIPSPGMRVRVARMRAGGGAAGNLAPGSLKEISALTLAGTVPQAKLKVVQALPTAGGQEAEALAEAERRIPALLRHGQRAITAEDYRRLAADTPGVQVGRVEVLPGFKPHQRREGMPGIVSVLVLPASSAFRAPNPRPDRPFLEAVHAHLDVRRPLAAELYVIGCEYVPVGVAAGITVREGYGREGVTAAVREALYRWLWPLPPGGAGGQGWPLGRAVRDRELEVAIAQVPGVETIAGVRLFTSGTVVRLPAAPGQGEGSAGTARFRVRPPPPTSSVLGAAPPRWSALAGPVPGLPVELSLEPWQLPELMGIAVDAEGGVPSSLSGAPDPFAGEGGIAVPVVPEVC